MSRMPLIILPAVLLGAAVASAQTLPASTVQAQGSATISVKPDQAQPIVSVSTDGTTAADASQKNATITNQVLSALNQMVDGNGTVQTIGYGINARYSNGPNPSVIGYTAVNTMQITTGDLSHLGNLIDTAVNNGATNIGALSFGLQNPEPQKEQALTAATKQALAHAAAIAAGAGRSVGPVVSAVEAGSVTPIVLPGVASTTPIQTGYATVSASVTVTVQLQYGMEIATLGGGCFWCLEAVYQQMEGVKSIVSGYMGGTVENPTYQQVCTGGTGHVEVVQLTFDPAVTSYSEILEVFFAIHDPTSFDRQGNDAGPQYRSVIFYHSDAQRAQAEAIMRHLAEEAVFDRPIVTELRPADTFYPAEDYHQDYFRNHSAQPYCAFVVAPKVKKFREKFTAKLR